MEKITITSISVRQLQVDSNVWRLCGLKKGWKLLRRFVDSRLNKGFHRFPSVVESENRARTTARQCSTCRNVMFLIGNLLRSNWNRTTRAGSPVPPRVELISSFEVSPSRRNTDEETTSDGRIQNISEHDQMFWRSVGVNCRLHAPPPHQTGLHDPLYTLYIQYLYIMYLIIWSIWIKKSLGTSKSISAADSNHISHKRWGF